MRRTPFTPITAERVRAIFQSHDVVISERNAAAKAASVNSTGAFYETTWTAEENVESAARFEAGVNWTLARFDDGGVPLTRFEAGERYVEVLERAAAEGRSREEVVEDLIAELQEPDYPDPHEVQEWRDLVEESRA